MVQVDGKTHRKNGQIGPDRGRSVWHDGEEMLTSA